MNRALVVWLCAAFLSALSTARAAEPPAPAPDVEALRKQADDLRQQDRALRDKLRAVETRIRKAPELVELRKAADAAEKAYLDKRKADPALTAALAADREARAALSKVVDEKLAASDQAQALRKQLADADDADAQLDFRQALANLELTHRSSPISRALSKDPEYAKLRKESYDAYNAARRATDKETREQANQVYERARKAYTDARKAKLATMPEARRVLAELENIKKEAAQLRKDQSETNDQLRDLRRAIERADDPDVKAARDRLAATAKAVRDATRTEALAAAMKLSYDARRAYSAKLRALLAADAEAAPLVEQQADLAKQSRELQSKLRQAARKPE